MTSYHTRFGALGDFDKGRVELVDDNPKNYVFSNVFEVCNTSAPYERVAVAKNFEYVIEAALAQAGSGLKDVVRARYIIVDPADWPKVAPVFGEYFGEIRPASTAIVCGLVDPKMKIEIEVTAKRQG